MLEGLECARGGRICGQRCPQIDNAPETPAGQAAWRVSQRTGVWRRAGLSGSVIGLDLTEALRTAEALGVAPDHDLVAALQAIEGGAVKACQAAEAEAARDRERNHDHG